MVQKIISPKPILGAKKWTLLYARGGIFLFQIKSQMSKTNLGGCISKKYSTADFYKYTFL